MKSLLTLALLVSLVDPAFAGGRRPAATSAPLQDELTIVFVGAVGGGRDAMVDVGVMSQKWSRGRRADRRNATTKTLSIRIDGRSGASASTATLRAFLESNDGGVTIRLDGVVLGSSPAVIDANVPIGTVRTHTLEIDVPELVPEGVFAVSVRWEATTN